MGGSGPASAPGDAADAGSGADGVGDCTRGVGPIPVTDPLPDIPDHVIQAKRIRLLFPPGCEPQREESYCFSGHR